MEPQTVKTRFLVLSDTHGVQFPENRKPQDPVDVVIHCGNLTQQSKLREFREAIRLLKGINAPLKLVIAGNHDFTLDTPTYKGKVYGATPPVDLEAVQREYGRFEEARMLLDEAAHFGIKFLDEGTHHFTLRNGAHLSIYASPYTPSTSDWGFQYDPKEEDRYWPIRQGVDIVMTHGPPQGIFDLVGSKRIGCPNLFKAVAAAKPLMHCFGHARNGWGAKLARWQHSWPEPVSSLTSINDEESHTIETLKALKAGRFDTLEMIDVKYKRVDQYEQARACTTIHSKGAERELVRGAETLFVNAAIEGTQDDRFHFPWVVELDLIKV